MKKSLKDFCRFNKNDQGIILIHTLFRRDNLSRQN